MRSLPVLNPANRFSSTELAYEEGEAPLVTLDVYEDQSRQILAKNDSPDVGFDFSVNPYRGCYHACAYCYARPTHEYLSFGAGTDFDRKLVIKPNAPELLRDAFHNPRWSGERVVFSGVTDCYQPIEAKYRLTRGCIEVCVEYKNPFGIITKSPLVERDIELLATAAKICDARVMVSIPFFDQDDAKIVEPGVPPPARRLKTIERLAAAGVPVGVMVAPIIPGLNDDDMPKVLAAARSAGATYAGTVLLRLPGAVKEVFEERIRAGFSPERANKIMTRIRDTRGGKLYDSTFGKRGTGEGPYAESIGALFDATVRRLGFAGADTRTGGNTFERPLARGKQLALF